MLVACVITMGFLLAAQATRPSQNAAALASYIAGERECEQAQAADSNLQRAQDVEDAVRVSQALWAHTEARACLELAISPHAADQEPSGPSIVKRIWTLEAKHQVLDGFSDALLAYLKSEVAAKVSREAALHKEVAAAEIKELGALKNLLENEYEFHYDVQKEACVDAANERLRAAAAQVEAELTAGCMGSCSKKSAVAGQCQETSAQNPCPEGTSCGCQMTQNKGLAVAVGTVSYLLSWGALAYLLGPAGSVMPGPMEMSVAMSFLVAGKAEGCRCMPSPCAWDAERQACAPNPTSGSRNPFQAALPYVGQVCAHKSEGLRAMAASVSSRLASPSCEMRPCSPEDAAKVGQVGSDTFNCQVGAAGQAAEATFPPLTERMQQYMELFPEFVKRHMEQAVK